MNSPLVRILHMELQTYEQKNYQIIEMMGRLDSEGATDLERFLAELGNPHHAILDFTEVDFVNSTGLRVVAKMLKACQQQSGKLILVGLNANLERVFATVGLLDLFETFGTVQAALDGR